MSAELTLLVNFALLLVAAEAGSLLFAALRLPRVVGMLVGGVLIGPAINPWAGALNLDAESISGIAFLGSIFLLFSIGLTFNPRAFRGVAGPALLVAVFAAFASFAAGYGIARAFGESHNTALFVGLLLAPTSSTVSLRLAQDMNLLGTRGIDITMTAIVFDDAIALVIATSVLAVIDPGGGGGALDTGLRLGLILILSFLIILIGVQTVPRALDLFVRVGRANPTLIIMSFAMFIALLFTRLELPPIFGAFWAGTMIAATRFGPDMRTFLRPVTELFSAVFFAAMGLLLAPDIVVAALPLAGLLVAAGVVAKFFGAFLPLRAGRVPAYSALMCATLLVPRGEVGLVIAQSATADVSAPLLRVLAVLLMVATTLLTPLLAGGIRAAFLVRRRAENPGTPS